MVNRMPAGGVGGLQVEQSLKAREEHWCEIADAVARVYESVM